MVLLNVFELVPNLYSNKTPSADTSDVPAEEEPLTSQEEDFDDSDLEEEESLNNAAAEESSNDQDSDNNNNENANLDERTDKLDKDEL